MQYWTRGNQLSQFPGKSYESELLAEKTSEALVPRASACVTKSPAGPKESLQHTATDRGTVRTDAWWSVVAHEAFIQASAKEITLNKCLCTLVLVS